MNSSIAQRFTGRVCLGLVCGLLPVLAGCGEKHGPKTDLIPEVSIVQPASEPVTDFLYFTGNAQASDTVQIQARVSGFLTKVGFKDGGLVKKDQLLFEIEPEPYIAKQQIAESTVLSSQAELQRATLDYTRLDNLVKQRAVSVADVEKAKADLDTAKAKLDQAKAQVDLAKLQAGYTQMHAPFDGRVDRKLRDLGNLVGVSEPTLLTTIYRMDPIYVYFSINEKDLVKVRRPRRDDEKRSISGAIEGEEGYPHEGVIDFGSSSLDPTTGTLLLRGVFRNPPLGEMPRIIPGMFLRLRVPVGERAQAVLVPERALGVDQSGRFVLVVQNDGTVDKKPVKVGAPVRDLRVIEEGLQGQEQVIVTGLQQARPGTKVKAIPAAPHTAEVKSPESQS